MARFDLTTVPPRKKPTSRGSYVAQPSSTRVARQVQYPKPYGYPRATQEDIYKYGHQPFVRYPTIDDNNNFYYDIRANDDGTYDRIALYAAKKPDGTYYRQEKDGKNIPHSEVGRRRISQHEVDSIVNYNRGLAMLDTLSRLVGPSYYTYRDLTHNYDIGHF